MLHEKWHPVFWHKMLKLLPPVLAVFYLSFHAISGDRGLYAWLKARRELESLQSQLTEVKTKRIAYERQLKGLHTQSLDLDLLDEQARQTLGFTGKDEIIVPLDSPQN